MQDRTCVVTYFGSSDLSTLLNGHDRAQRSCYLSDYKKVHRIIIRDNLESKRLTRQWKDAVQLQGTAQPCTSAQGLAQPKICKEESPYNNKHL